MVLFYLAGVLSTLRANDSIRAISRDVAFCAARAAAAWH
jgi:hypothetical protein